MSQKNLFVASAFIALLLMITSCEKVTGEGPLRTEVRNRGNFTGIDMRISGNVYFKTDSLYKIDVTAQENLLNEIETNIVGNNLVIKFRDGVRVRSHDEITVSVSAPELSSIRLSGSGNISTDETKYTRNFFIDLSGSGNVIMQQLVTDFIDAKLSGSGNITVLNGNAREEKLKISGSGNMDLLNVASESAQTSTSGSGSVKLNVAEHLDVSISGSGSVLYKGDPAVTAKVSGSGKVIKL